MYIKNKNIIIKIICLLFLFSNISHAAEMDFKGELQFESEVPQYIQTPRKDLKEDTRVDKYLIKQYEKRKNGTYSYNGLREKTENKTLNNRIKEITSGSKTYPDKKESYNSNGEAGKGKFGLPCKLTGQYISSGYGYRKVNGSGPFHHAIDITGPGANKRPPIFASADGKVIAAAFGDESSSYGNAIRILHKDGYVTKYAHLARIMVTVGQEVKAGEQIAEMGNTGHVVGANGGHHLHFEIRKPPGKWGFSCCVNPVEWLNEKI